MRINRDDRYAILLVKTAAKEVWSDRIRFRLEKEGTHGHNQLMYDREK